MLLLLAIWKNIVSLLADGIGVRGFFFSLHYLLCLRARCRVFNKFNKAATCCCRPARVTHTHAEEFELQTGRVNGKKWTSYAAAWRERERENESPR